MKIPEKAAEKPAATDAPQFMGLIIPTTSEYEAALTLGGVQLKDNGVNLYAYWKEQLKPGVLKDARGKVWNIKPSDIDDAISDTNRALLMGWRPVVQNDHWHPTESFGKITAVRKNKQGGMEFKHEFVGEKKRDDALALHTSVMLIPDYETQGHKFKWFPMHSAACFNPQVKNLKDYEPALAASGETVNATILTLSESQSTGTTPEKVGSKMDLTQLRAYLGKTAEGKPDEEIPTLALSAMTETSQKLADQTEANQILVGELSAAEAARDQAKQAALALSATNDDEEMTPQVLALSQKAYLGEIHNSELERQQGKPGLNAEQAAWLRKTVKESGALMLSADLTGVTEVDRMIAFAKLGHNAIDPNRPLNRGTAARPLPTPPGTALALAGKSDDECEEMDEDGKPKKKTMKPERKAELMAAAGYHEPVKAR